MNAWAGTQPRYVKYCQDNGAESPDAMLAIDRERWPGGCMTGFILWIMDRWQDYRALTGLKGAPGQAEHDAFDAWLASEPAKPSEIEATT